MKFKDIRKLIGILPKRLRHEIFRSLVFVDPQPPSQLKIKIAQTREELERSFRLLHNAYIKVNYMKPSPSGMRLSFYQAIPYTTTIVALWDDRVVGTISLIRDNSYGLPLDFDFNTRFLKNRYRSVGEVTSLAIDPEFRSRKGGALFPMLKYLFEYACRHMMVDIFQLATNPGRSDFYQSFFFADFIDKMTIRDKYVNNAVMAAMYIDLVTLEKNMIRHFANKRDHKNIYKYFFKLDLGNFILPSKQYFFCIDPVMTPEYLDYFFNQKSAVFQDLTFSQKLALHNLYHSDDYRKVLPPFEGRELSLLNHRASIRFPFSSEGEIQAVRSSDPNKAIVKDVSRNGLSLHTEVDLNRNRFYSLDLGIGDLHTSDIVVQPVWQKNRNEYGCTLIDSDQAWHHMIQHLENHMTQLGNIGSQG